VGAAVTITLKNIAFNPTSVTRGQATDGGLSHARGVPIRPPVTWVWDDNQTAKNVGFGLRSQLQSERRFEPTFR
jgi:hypothetical protein